MKDVAMRALDLLERSVIVQALITLGALYTMFYLVITGHDVPTVLQLVVTSLLGYYFGTKGQTELSRLRQRISDNVTNAKER